MKGIFDWLTRNKAGVSILAIAAAAALGIAVVSGCTASDFVKVKVPTEVQKATNTPAKVSLTEAPEVLEDYVRGGERFKDNIERGYEILGFLTSLTDVGIEFGKGAIPGGALGLSLLTGLGGLFLKGPGTAKEKRDSYNKGIEEGKRLAESALATLSKNDGGATG